MAVENSGENFGRIIARCDRPMVDLVHENIRMSCGHFEL